MSKVRIWDLPTRVFHWALVACIVGLVVTGQIGGTLMAWHFRLGYVVLSLLLFRLVWGFVGGHWSRFAVFVRSPATIAAYLRGHKTPEMEAGHNPLGALSVLALLTAALVQAGSGLFSDDDIMNTGPLAHLVGSDWVSLATAVHTRFNKFTLLALVALHIGAIVFYRVVKRNNLVQAMVSGDKDLNVPVPPTQDGWQRRLLALALFFGLMSAVWFAAERLGRL